MASRIGWHLPVQEEADWLRLLLFENEVERKQHECIYQTFLFIPRQQTLVAHTLKTDCIEWCLHKKKNGPVWAVAVRK